MIPIRSRRRHCLVTCGLLALALGSALVALAAAPTLIPFQGRLTDPDGQAQDDGAYTLIFALYDQAVGGNVLWSETHPRVGVVAGQVSLLLGAINPTLATNDFSQTRYLGVTIDPDNNPNTPDPEMVPRQLLVPAFFAKEAGIALGAKPGSIQGNMIAAGAVTAEKLAPGAALANLAPGSITADRLTADAGVRSLEQAGILGEGVAILSTLPVNPTLQSQGYVRDIEPLAVGSNRFYLYRKVAAATPRWTLARADGSELRDGQLEPLAFGVTILDLPTELPLTVRNLGNTSLSGLAARFDGDQAAEFSGTLAQASLPPGATTILAMRYQAREGVLQGAPTAGLHLEAVGVSESFDVPLQRAIPPGFGLIPAGPFKMGVTSGDTDANAPSIDVTVSAFLMQTNEVTKAQWDGVRTWGLTNGYTDLAVGGGKAANHPVQTVSWFDVIKWCNARSAREGLKPVYTVSGLVMKTGTAAPDADWTANGYRLPTEAEWEKAARGGVTGKRFPWGDTISHTEANFNNAGTEAYRLGAVGYHRGYTNAPTPYTSPVGSFPVNGYGLADMSGNVYEWCWDWYGDTYYTQSRGTSDPRGASSGTDRVLRGGSWVSIAIGSRCAVRFWSRPDVVFSVSGFRPARGRL